MTAVHVIIPHWHTPESKQWLPACIDSWLDAGAASIHVMTAGPLAEGGSSIGRNINRGFEAVFDVVPDSDFVLVVNDDITWLSGDLALLCTVDACSSPGPQPFWGPAFCLPIYAVQHVGMFDTRFDGYCEDDDFAIRVRLGGYQLRAAPTVAVDHFRGGGNTVRMLDAGALMQRNRDRLFAKWGPECERIWLADEETFRAWQQSRRPGRG